MYDRDDIRYFQEILDVEVRAEGYRSYNDFIEAKIDAIPEHLLFLFSTVGGEQTLLSIQTAWIQEFWENKNKS